MFIEREIWIFSRAFGSGMGDRGLSAIHDFEGEHKCNDVCRALGLADLRKSDSATEASSASP